MAGEPAPAAPFDRALLDRRRKRWSRKDAARPTFLIEAVAAEIVERLSLVQRRFEIGVDLAGDSGHLARAIMAGGQVDCLLRIERDPHWLADAPPGSAIVGDEEMLPLADGSVDLVVSALSLHLTNDTPGALVQIRRALKPDGLLMCALLGGETLSELRSALITAEAEIDGGAAPRVAPFVDLRDAGALLQRTGFALPVIDQDRLTARYDSMFELMSDIRGMGMANMLNARSRRPLGRRVFLRAAEIYGERSSDPDGRVRATFDVVYLSGWRPHDSQQKPLRPGSAKTSLAEALKAR